MSQNFKCILVGDGFCGKTTFVRRLISEFELEKVKFQPLAYVYPITFNTNIGNICFNVFDTNTQEFNCGLKDSFFLKSHCAIIMFDVTSPASYENVLYWHRKVLSICGKIPIALCGNKVDIQKHRKIKYEKALNDWGKRLRYFDISAKTRTCVYDPFLYLCEKLTCQGPIVCFSKIGRKISIGLLSVSRLLEEAKEKNSKIEA